MVISAFLLNLALTTFESIVVITILFVTVEYFIRRNYGLAQFFNAYGSDAFIARSSAVRDNVDSIPLLGIVLGSLLGLAAACYSPL